MRMAEIKGIPRLTFRRGDSGLVNVGQNAIIIRVGRLGSNRTTHLLLTPPPISGRLQIVCEYVTPRHHQRNQHDAQKTVNQCFRPPKLAFGSSPPESSRGSPKATTQMTFHTNSKKSSGSILIG
jgi:hypothetical protein